MTVRDFVKEPDKVRKAILDLKNSGRRTADEAFQILDAHAARVRERRNEEEFGDVSQNPNDLDALDAAALPPGARALKSLEVLTEREIQVIRWRYGLDGEAVRTLQDIAAEVHVTRERVRQVESKALRRLQNGRARFALGAFVETVKEGQWAVLVGPDSHHKSFTERQVKDHSDSIATNSSLTNQLKGKSRRRRDDLVRMAQAAATPLARRNDLLPRLAISYMPLSELRSSTRKLRRLDPVHVREVAATISALGFCDPILIGKDNVIIDGEVRLEAAKVLGLGRAPCIRVEHLSDEERRLLRLAVNRLGEKGQWNLDELKIEFEELVLADAPIEISGFSLDEIDQLVIGDKLDSAEQGPLEPNPDAVAVARVGDVFQLGLHRLICGDATDPEVLARVMEGDAPARLVLTDEPYNVKIAGHVTGGPHREFAMASGEMSDAEFLAFNVAWIEAAAGHLRDGGVFGTFINWRGLPTVHAATATLGLSPLNLIVWAKTNAGMGSLYRSQHGRLPLFKKGDAPHVNNVELGKKGRWRSNVWTYPGASSLGSDARRGLRDYPTVKPTAMLQDALLDLTHRGEIVLDPFLGSGSTLIAAERTGRVCRGVELDPLYVDVIVRRYEAATGEAAVLHRTGEAFAVLATARVAEAHTVSIGASRDPGAGS